MFIICITVDHYTVKFSPKEEMKSDGNKEILYISYALGFSIAKEVK
jgi:hypothetical protein